MTLSQSIWTRGNTPTATPATRAASQKAEESVHPLSSSGRGYPHSLTKFDLERIYFTVGRAREGRA